MKKHLLTTTALVAAGVMAFSGAALADKPSLKITGSFEQGVGVQSSDIIVTDDDKVVQHEEGEIQVTASMKLDNGITVSGRTELETEVESNRDGGKAGGAVDESFMDVTGTFGKIRIGATDGAMYEMAYGYMGHVGAGAGHLNLEFDSALAPAVMGKTGPGGLGIGRGLPRLTNDAETVLYFTPRISGLQAGISYAQTDGTDTPLVDVVSTAVNYNGKFGDAAVGAVVGYAQGDGDGVKTHDTTVMSGGVKVSVGGFTGAVGAVRNSRDNDAANEDFTRVDVGLRYSFGPNAVRVAYIALSDDATVDQTGTVATFSRSLGPGVSWSLDALMTSDKEEDKDASFFGTSVAIKF